MISLVKITPDTIVYAVGHNDAGYSSDPDHVTVFADLDSARDYLADELDRFAEFVWEGESNDPESNEERADEMAASITASAEIVRNDRDGDVAWSVAKHGGWTTYEDDGRPLPTAYWIHQTTLAGVFGDDTGSEEYEEVIDALLAR